MDINAPNDQTHEIFPHVLDSTVKDGGLTGPAIPIKWSYGKMRWGVVLCLCTSSALDAHSKYMLCLLFPWHKQLWDIYAPID